MSDLSAGIHALENTVEAWIGHLPPEGQAAIKQAVTTAQTAASTSIVVNSSSLDTIWNALEVGIEAVINTGEVALLGPQGGQIAIGLTDAALEALAAKAHAQVNAKIASIAAARGTATPKSAAA